MTLPCFLFVPHTHTEEGGRSRAALTRVAAQTAKKKKKKISSLFDDTNDHTQQEGRGRGRGRRSDRFEVSQWSFQAPSSGGSPCSPAGKASRCPSRRMTTQCTNARARARRSPPPRNACKRQGRTKREPRTAYAVAAAPPYAMLPGSPRLEWLHSHALLCPRPTVSFDVSAPTAREYIHVNQAALGERPGPGKSVIFANVDGQSFALGTLEKGRTDMFQVRPCERAAAQAPHCWPRLRRIRLGRRRYARRAGSPSSTFIFRPSEV